MVRFKFFFATFIILSLTGCFSQAEEYVVVYSNGNIDNSGYVVASVSDSMVEGTYFDRRTYRKTNCKFDMPFKFNAKRTNPTSSTFKYTAKYKNGQEKVLNICTDTEHVINVFGIEAQRGLSNQFGKNHIVGRFVRKFPDKIKDCLIVRKLYYKDVPVVHGTPISRRGNYNSTIYLLPKKLVIKL